MANEETRILKNNSVEELRQKTNEVSLNLGDNKLLDSRLTDKVYSYTASAGQTIFENARIEHKPEETVDNTSGYIIFTGTPTIPGSFTAGSSVTQSGGFSATIVSISTTKLLVKNSAGTFNTGQNLLVGSDSIPHAKIVRIVTEAYPKGLLTVTKGGTELVQDATSTNGFHLVNYVLEVILTGSPTIPASFTEGVTLTQSGGFSGVLLSASSTQLKFKNFSGSFSNSANLGAPHGDASNRIQAANISSNNQLDNSFGTAIELNTPASASDAIVIKTTNLVDAITEVQDDVGNIANLQTNSKLDIVNSINELEVGLRGTSNNLVATDLTTTANDLVSAINEHETDIGDVADINNASGFSATSVVTGITETQSHIGTKASLTTSATSNLVAAINEVDANADASIKLTSGTLQTTNSNITFGTSGKTFKFDNGTTLLFASGTTLDIRSGSLLTGGGAGSSLGFDTAFLDLTANTSIRGLSFERSDHISGAPDVEIRFNEGQVSANKEARAFQVKGLDDSGSSQVADLVTFYNAKELITSNTESGINVTWDSTAENFDFNVDDFTITLAGDLSGNVTITDLASATLTATVVANSVALGTDTTGDYIGTITGTSNEISVSGSGTEDRDVTIGLPNDVTISGDLSVNDYAEVNALRVGLTGSDPGDNNLAVNGNATIAGNTTITGNLTVNGTQTTLSTATLEVEDTLVLVGSDLGNTNEPTTGGFGLETRKFSALGGTTIGGRQWESDGTHPNAASNVDGSHSIVYNFATDRWEADGSLILSQATLGSPKIENNAFESGDNLNFVAGTGMTLSTGKSGTTHTVTFTNDDKGTDVMVFKTVASDSGNAVADTNTDTLTITGGNDLSTSVSGDTLTIQHDNSGVSAGTYGSQHVVPRFTVDARGHVTGVTNQSAITLASLGYTGSTAADNYGSFNIATNDTGGTSAIGSGETLTIQGGTYISATRSGDTITLAHEDTSSFTTTTVTGTFIFDQIASDNMGHITGVSTRQLTLADFGYTGASNADRYSSWSFDTSSNGTNESVTSGDVVRFSAGTGMQVNHSGDTITFTNTAPNVTTNLTTTQTGNLIRINSSDGTDATIAAASTAHGGIMTIAQVTKLNGIDANATNTVDGVTSVATGNGIGGGTITGTGTLTVGAGNGLSQSTTGLLMSGSYSGAFSATGDITANTSDERLKDFKGNIDNALDKLSKIGGYYFNWNDTAKGIDSEIFGDELQVGVNAQEILAVMPEVIAPAPIVKEHDLDVDYKTVRYEKLVPLLIEAIKELKEEIEELKKHK